MKNKKTISDITEMGILVALSIVLDRFIKIPISITGGSINFALVPLFVIALRHGTLKSFIASGLVFSLITCLLDGYGIICFPFDYFVAFSPVFILGIFAKKIYSYYNNKKINSFIILNLCILSQGIIRFFSASLDSVILYNYSWSAAFLYNLTYIPLATFINMIVLSILLPIIVKLNKRFDSNFLNSIN